MKTPPVISRPDVQTLPPTLEREFCAPLPTPGLPTVRWKRAFLLLAQMELLENGWFISGPTYFSKNDYMGMRIAYELVQDGEHEQLDDLWITVETPQGMALAADLCRTPEDRARFVEYAKQKLYDVGLLKRGPVVMPTSIAWWAMAMAKQSRGDKALQKEMREFLKIDGEAAVWITGRFAQPIEELPIHLPIGVNPLDETWRSRERLQSNAQRALNKNKWGPPDAVSSELIVGQMCDGMFGEPNERNLPFGLLGISHELFISS